MNFTPAHGPDTHGSEHSHLEDTNTSAVIRVGLLSLISALFAATAPPELFTASLSWLVFCAAGVSSLTAALIGDDPWAPHFTRWDDAAWLLMFSMIAGWLVDPEAVRSVIEAAGREAG